MADLPNGPRETRFEVSLSRGPRADYAVVTASRSHHENTGTSQN
jgi:hypothetical protein